ncbi:hypothetical protein TeGR_g7016, partial [Tetraparma gracilis]
YLRVWHEKELDQDDVTTLFMEAPCRNGFYSSTGDSTDTPCTACSPGTSTATFGSTSAADCTSCAPGSFSDSGIGITACTPCAPSTFNPSPGSTSCSACPRGLSSSRGAVQTCFVAEDCQQILVDGCVGASASQGHVSGDYVKYEKPCGDDTGGRDVWKNHQMEMYFYSSEQYGEWLVGNVCGAPENVYSLFAYSAYESQHPMVGPPAEWMCWDFNEWGVLYEVRD